MNLLGLIFSLLLILSFGYYAIWDKHATGRRLRNTYISHNQAARKLINKFESEIYNSIGSKKREIEEESSQNKKMAKEEEQNDDDDPDDEKILELNPACARLNLWPLIHEGRENHPDLYDLAVKLIRTFYRSISTDKQFETRFLNQLLNAAKKTEPFSLEKISLDDPGMQKIYYKMLKGTKDWDLRTDIGYPPLLDYVKAEPSNEKLCVFHAHPDMITVLFGSKIAWKLHQEIHKKDGAQLTQALIERLGSELHILTLDQKLFDLLLLTSYPNCQDCKKIFIAKDGDVRIRKNLSIRN